MIWFKDYKLEEIKNIIRTENILDRLGIEFVDVGPDFVKVRMPVDERTHQVHGILHGGATCVLAETAGSFASLMCIDLSATTLSVRRSRPITCAP